MNGKFKLAAAIAVTLAALGVAGSNAFAGPVSGEHGPNLVTNGDFETGNLSGWTTSGNDFFIGVDCVDGCLGTAALYAGPQGGPLGFITQTLATSPGQSYNIHLFLQVNDFGGGATPNQFTVEWGIGNVVYSATDLPAQGYTEIVIDPVALGTTTDLRFGFRDDPAILNLDNISVTAVPEPLSLALLGLGLGALGWSRRRTQA